MMRSAGALPAAGGALGLFILAVLYPGGFIIGEVFSAPTDIGGQSMSGLYGRTLLWAFVVGLGAMIFGWGPGRWLGSSRRHGRAGAAVIVLPLMLPPYAVFYGWWQAWPPDSAVFAWAVEHDLMGALRQITLWLALTAWSWPLVAFCVAAGMRGQSRQVQELLALDGATRGQRLIAAARLDGPMLLWGGGLTALLCLNNTTTFDLAQIYTVGNELRAVRSMGANAAEVVRLALPAIGLTMAGLLILGLFLRRSAPGSGPLRPAPGLGWLTLVIMVMLFAAPAGLFIINLLTRHDPTALVTDFLRLYRDEIGNTLIIGISTAGLSMVLCAGMAVWLYTQSSRAARIVALVMMIGWALAAVIPALVVVMGMIRGYNTTVMGINLYQTPVVLLLGLLARFGIVPALLALWVWSSEPQAVRDLRRLDGAGAMRGMLAARRGPLLGAMLAAGIISGGLAMSEIAITSHLQPITFRPITPVLLNDMHYQRPQTVVVALAVFLLIGIAMALTLVAAARWRSVASTSIIALALVILPGCHSEPQEDQPLPVNHTFGATGRAPGQFVYPRAIAVDAANEWVYIVDKTARVQRLSYTGEPLAWWDMPARDIGKPTGIDVALDGRVFVSDTHYFRIIVYDKDGTELMRFGSHGEEPGQFIFPTGVAFGPDERLYVLEYGGNDRIQVFDKDANYLFEFGTPGPKQHNFDRPQSAVFNDDLTELYIADAVNHRIVVTDPQGEVLRILTAAPSSLMYPYDLALLDDDRVLVAEFGHNRLHLLEADTGASIRTFGRVGHNAGELQYPWGVAVSGGAGDATFVLDSGNNRVQVMDTP